MIIPRPEPTEHHRALAALEGRFRATEPAPPDGGEAPIGTYEMRVGLAGFALVLDYEQVLGGARHYSMHGVIGWDSSEERYFFHWYDSLGGLGTGMRGQMDDRSLVLEGPDESRGGRARFTFELADGDAGFTLTMAFSTDGESWNEAMVARYQRLH